MGEVTVKRRGNIGFCSLQARGRDFDPIYYLGSLKLLKRAKKVAIVGSRNASEWALRCARLIAREFGRRGVVIVSGYARGIDSEAHKGALEGKRGATVIVLPEGLLEFKPNKLEGIPNWRKRTLVLSQFAPHEKWKASNAMKRNEVICALSDAVIVVEAGPERDENGKMSGSFQAGKTALKLGVPLFVIIPEPGQLPFDDGSILNVPVGNAKLAEEGAISLPIDPKDLRDNARGESIKNAVRKVIGAIQRSGSRKKRLGTKRFALTTAKKGNLEPEKVTRLGEYGRSKG
jgi:DNA processing protein